MPITFKLDESQMRELRQQHAEQIHAIANLSANLGKWLGNLTQVLSGEEDSDTQTQIDSYAAKARVLREKLQTAINKQPKGD